MSKTNPSEASLPSIWSKAPLGDFGAWHGGGTPSKANSSYWTGKIPWVSPKDMKTDVVTQCEDHITQEAVENSSTRLVPSGTVLVVTRSGILEHTLPVALAGMPVALNQDLKALVPHVGIDSRYVALSLRCHSQLILKSCRKAGTTVASIDFEQLKEFELPLPPTNEQRRIVSRLESLLARSRRAKEALDAIPAQLERLRQSVLAAAFRGDLTADWRAQHPDVEPASKLLERIRAERRRRWEEAELEKMRAKGKVPKNDEWKNKYKASSPLEVEELPSIPSTWDWAPLEALSALIIDGDHNPPKRVPQGIAHLTAKNIRNWQINFKNCSYITPADFNKTRSRYEPLAGDVIITCVGTVGETAIVPAGMVFSADRNLAAVRLLEVGIQNRLLLYFLNSPYLTQRMGSASGSTAQPHLYLGDLRQFPIPVPPIDEQNEIITRAERIITILNSFVKTYHSASERFFSLESTLLAKAFRGEIVPQDPDDEPASVLLERIRAEREATAGSVPKRSRGRRPAA